MRQRLLAQLLTGPPATSARAVVERILAVQAQDPRGARLAVRARSTGVRAADVDAALGERSLLITWLNRGTLHLVRAEDYPWLHAITAPRLRAAVTTRLAHDGVSPGAAQRAVALLDRWLREDGPLVREELRRRLRAAGLQAEGQALVHLVFLASVDGVLVRGPMVGKQHAYVSVPAWLGEPAPVDRSKALAELARRYLRGHAPATDRDLAYWAGISLGDARAGLAAAGRSIRLRDDGLLEPARTALPPAPPPPPRLLGPFDPVLHGWSSRRWVTGEHDAALISGGVFRPFVLVRGRAMGVWRWAGGRVALEALEPLGPRAERALQRDASALADFLA